jgi:PhnB protein
MSFSVHVTYCGQCEAALRFYQRCFDGTFLTSVTMMRYGETPMAAQVPDDWREKIVHASLKIGHSTLAGADVLPKDYLSPRGFFLLLDIEDASKAERVFHALAEHGTVTMPLQETFWARRFGVLTDQFGIPWEINCGASSAAV